MNKNFFIFSIIIWLIFSTLSLSYLWLHHPDAIPRPPEKVALFLTDFFDAKDADSIGVLEVYSVFLVTSLVSSVMTFFGYKIWKKFKFKF
ncbi:hypothetical protein RGU70_15335 [Herbaspirillum sp. RTI4]|uniref:hypothetical protein n=1 Tax=Herbaspirillum sp. RTI4 TaxID=3048640 RepID=UPI002AB4E5BC|nr:hypothetical protein [Herbaspirillum sp. RTI4]MDY7579686.1 hypothetical protein [Herbaspirillum sp. RTI4]